MRFCYHFYYRTSLMYLAIDNDLKFIWASLVIGNRSTSCLNTGCGIGSEVLLIVTTLLQALIVLTFRLVLLFLLSLIEIVAGQVFVLLNLVEALSVGLILDAMLGGSADHFKSVNDQIQWNILELLEISLVIVCYKFIRIHI